MCSDTTDEVQENVDDYNLNIKGKILIVFDEMIADITTSKKTQSILKFIPIKELFISCRKLNISLPFITQSYFTVSKDVKLNSTHYLMIEINYKRKL